jgi:hypothetical protein
MEVFTGSTPDYLQSHSISSVKQIEVKCSLTDRWVDNFNETSVHEVQTTIKI